MTIFIVVQNLLTEIGNFNETKYNQYYERQKDNTINFNFSFLSYLDSGYYIYQILPMNVMWFF